MPSSAEKYRELLKTVRSDGFEPAHGIDVVDHRRAVGRAIAAPQFVAVRAVVGREKQRAVQVGQLAGRRLRLPGLMSLTSVVTKLPAVPLVDQSSCPWVPSLAVK